MRLKEQKVWDSMKRNAPKTGVVMERIENVVGDGIPDVLVGVRPERWTFVELKAAICPKRSSTPLMGKDGLRPSQVNWHIKAASLQLPSWVLIRDDQMNLYLIPGKLAADMNDYTMSECRQHSAASNWKEIFEVISA